MQGAEGVGMRLEPIERKVLRAVGVVLAVVALGAGGLALWSRYQVYAEQKAAEQRREYEQQMARLMEQELLAEGMSRGVVRATLGAPDSVWGQGELAESWYYGSTRNYGSVLLRFEHQQLVDIERTASDPPEGGGAPPRATVALMHPTEPIQPPLDGSIQWRLISQLSLNYLSLVGEDSGAPAGEQANPGSRGRRSGAPLRELLRLYNFGDTSTGEKHVQGITAVQSDPWYARVRSEQGLSFARGRRVTLELDEDHFSGGGTYLFASVIERFLAMYASMNSFSALVARVRSKQKTYTLKEWQPRAGFRPLI